MTQTAQQKDSHQGLLSGAAAYVMWGLFPIYFVLTKSVPALEILGHRIVWSVPFCFLVILFRRQLKPLWSGLKNGKTVLYLTIAAIFLSINWGLYIWAIQIEEIMQASLGYYINPLCYVIVGVMFFNEAMSRLQWVAIALAFMGVSVLTLYGGVFPWISITLALTFTAYGVFKKFVDIGAMPGLQIETLVLLPLALLMMAYLAHSPGLAFGSGDWKIDALMVFAGPMTILPLFAFSFAARRIKLSTLGILQYIGPSLQFICALYYGEVFTPAHAWCFGLIWTGVALFAWDGWRVNRRTSS